MKWKKAILTTSKVLVGIIGSVFLLLVILILLIRLPSVQDFITHRAVSYISGKTHKKISLGKLWISFPKSVVLEKLYAEDASGDTLLFLDKLNVDIDLLALLKHKVKVDHLLLSNVNANISRSAVDSTYNFNFFIKAFSADKKKAPTVKTNTAKGDTTGWQIEVDKLQLENIRGSFADGVSGIDIKGYIGALTLNMKSIDIRHLDFSGHNLSLSDADVSIIQTRSNHSVEDSTVALLPLLALDKVDLKRVKFLYRNEPHNQSFAVHVGTLSVIPDRIDLNTHNVHIRSIYLAESDGHISLQKNFDPKQVATDTIGIDTSGLAWQVSGDSVSLHQVDFNYDLSNVPRKTSGFDYNHIGLRDVSMVTGKVSYSTKTIAADVHSLSLKEQSGFDMQKMSVHGDFDYTKVTVYDLTLTTSNSQIDKSNITVSGLDKVSKNVGSLGIEANLSPATIGTKDIFLFAPQVQRSLQINGDKVSVSGHISGTLDNITATNLLASAGPNTSAALNGHITGLPNAVNANYDLDIKSARSTRDDLNAFLKNTLPVSISIPESFSVSGTVRGSVKNASANISLQSTSGNVNITALMKMTAQDTQYSVKLHTVDLDLGKILKDTLLGKVTADINAQGQNFSLNNIVADAQLLIDSLSFKHYTYECLSVDACADRGEYNAMVSVYDPNVVLDLDAAFSYAPDDMHIQLGGVVEGINLQKTKLMSRDLRLGAKVNANIVDSAGNINGVAGLDKIVVVQGGDKYKMDSISLIAVTDSGHSHFTLQSDIADADYKGTAKVQNLGKTLISYINGYFPLPGFKDSTLVNTEGQSFKLNVSVFPHPLISEVIFPGVKDFSGASLTTSFDNDKHKLDLDLSASALAYGAVRTDLIDAAIHSVNDSLKYGMTFQDLSAGPVRLGRTSLAGFLKAGVVSFLLDVRDSLGGDKLLMSGNLKEPEEKDFALHIESKNLLLNNSTWDLAADNLIKFGGEGINIHDFVLKHGDQSLSIRSQTERGNSPINLSFVNFHLGTISQIIESDSALVRGHMNGTVELRNLATNPAFTSDLTIDSIAYQEHPIGNISLKANNLTDEKYQAELVLSGAGNDIKVSGSYIASASQSNIALKADIQTLNVQSIEPFTGGQIRRSKGYLSGSADITGSFTAPKVNADLAFTDAAFNVAYINNYISLKNDHIKVDPQGIYFNSFTILDSFGKKAAIDGRILTTDFRKMKFDLSVNTDNFTALNTRAGDNPLFYGRVLFSSQIFVRGDQSLPIVDGHIQLLDATSVTVIVPSSKISVDRGNGVVVMVSHEDTTNRILTTRDTVSNKLEFKGVDVRANVEIDKKASFKVIVDKTSGDSLVVRGEGKLSFLMDASGNQNLTGTYTLSGGSYDASFQHVIHKHFEIKDGSTITWNGQLLDAVLDVTAVYGVRAAPSDLVATEISGLSESEKAGYNKPLGFDVYLTMRGELLKPDITFKLDMDDRDKAAFSGLVYSKVNSVNNDASTLNSEVFSLLILGKFMPIGTGGSTDYGSVATDLARNSVNQILQDQLNSLSGKYIKGVDLNFGVQSNDEYTATGINQNTQLSVAVKKQFLNDRLGVQVGTSVNVPNSSGAASSYNSNSITGNFQIDYKLTPDGRYQFKVFCLNEYEGFIEGLVYKTGVSVVYTKNYNTLRELFARRVKTPDASKPKDLKQ